jgi:hypothetical protein
MLKLSFQTVLCLHSQYRIYIERFDSPHGFNDRELIRVILGIPLSTLKESILADGGVHDLSVCQSCVCQQTRPEFGHHSPAQRLVFLTIPKSAYSYTLQSPSSGRYLSCKTGPSRGLEKPWQFPLASDSEHVLQGSGPRCCFNSRTTGSASLPPTCRVAADP